MNHVIGVCRRPGTTCTIRVCRRSELTRNNAIEIRVYLYGRVYKGKSYFWYVLIFWKEISRYIPINSLLNEDFLEEGSDIH